MFSQNYSCFKCEQIASAFEFAQVLAAARGCVGVFRPGAETVIK